MAKRPKKAKVAKCCSCLAEIKAAEYFANDFYCTPCALKATHYPLRTTP